MQMSSRLALQKPQKLIRYISKLNDDDNSLAWHLEPGAMAVLAVTLMILVGALNKTYMKAMTKLSIFSEDFRFRRLQFLLSYYSVNQSE